MRQHKVVLDPAELKHLYIDMRLSLQATAIKCGVSVTAIRNHLLKLGVKIRTAGEALATDLSGRRYGQWEVTSEKCYDDLLRKHLRWKCKCLVCGEYKWVLGVSLYSGRSKMCQPCRRRLNKPRYGEITYSHWQVIINAAKQRNWPFLITIEYAWALFESQNRKCALSGVPLVFGYKTKTTASLDRIDPNKGYVDGNVQWVDKDINRMKWKYTQEKFVETCIRVAKHHGVI